MYWQTNTEMIRTFYFETFVLKIALHILFSATFQKLPEVLDLGDIDLDRKRLRKQLQVVIKDYMNEICVTTIPIIRNLWFSVCSYFNPTGT